MCRSVARGGACRQTLSLPYMLVRIAGEVENAPSARACLRRAEDRMIRHLAEHREKTFGTCGSSGLGATSGSGSESAPTPVLHTADRPAFRNTSTSSVGWFVPPKDDVSGSEQMSQGG